MDQSSTTLTPVDPDSGDLLPVAADAQTIYVLPEDVLILPCGPDVGMGTLQNIEQHLGLAHIVMTEGLTRPWILRKATPA